MANLSSYFILTLSYYVIIGLGSSLIGYRGIGAVAGIGGSVDFPLPQSPKVKIFVQLFSFFFYAY